MMGSRETMAKSRKRLRRSSARRLSSSARPVRAGALVKTESSFLVGASCSFELSSSQTSSPLCQTRSTPESFDSPSTVISVWKVSQRLLSSSRFSGLTASTMRSCDSERKICHESMFVSLSGARSR